MSENGSKVREVPPSEASHGRNSVVQREVVPSASQRDDQNANTRNQWDPYARDNNRDVDDYYPEKHALPADERQDEVPLWTQFDDVDADDELISPAVILPWRIGLLLFVSTLVQNFSYNIPSWALTQSTEWLPSEKSQFNSLVYYMLYLGPVWGVITDIVRVCGERYRPVILVAAAGNAALCFVAFADKHFGERYGRSLVVSWLMQVLVMFIYIPLNSVVIVYGNSLLYSEEESSARIGGLMSQTMVWRSTGSFVYNLVSVLASERIHDGTASRWWCLCGGISSCVLIVLMLLPWVAKRSYFVDRRETTLKHTAPVRFFMSSINYHRNATSARKKARGSSFWFILCFVFIYFMLPDVLYTTLYSFTGEVLRKPSTHWSEGYSLAGSAATILGSLAYALWMYFSYENERKRHNRVKANPFVIVLAGCSAWAFGTFFHLFGVMGYSNSHFNYHVFLQFETVIVSMMMRFAFMPTLSLAAMHAPRGYETTAFQLFSVDTSGGGLVSSAVTYNLASSLNIYNAQTYDMKWGKYWELVLICIFFQFLPLLIALSLPKYRDGVVTVSAKQVHEEEPLRDPEERLE